MSVSNDKPRPRQARELARRLGLLTEAQAAAGWGIIVFLAALLGLIYLNQARRIGEIGRRVQEEQSELSQIKLENGELERQIAEAQSLDRLEARAVALGFVPSTPADIEYVVIPDYPVEAVVVPLRNETFEEPPAPPETMLEAVSILIRDMGIDLTRGVADE